MTANSHSHLTEMLADESALSREFKKRTKEFDFSSVARARVDELIAAGWQEDQKLKIRVRMKRPKSHDERLENRFWCLLYRLGYPELNKGRQFKVLIQRKGAEDLLKQIDVLGKDDETVIVAECKSQEALRKKSLQKEIAEFASLQKPIASAVRKHYGPDFRPKIVWVFVTDNIVWTKPDLERATGHSIRRITERELRYFSQIAAHLGPAARYQFLAEFLEGQKIPGLSGIKIPAIKGRLGKRHFYSFVTTPAHLLKIAFVNHRSLNDPGGVPSYQRLVNKNRIRAIGKFIDGGGFFPTNLLVNFKKKVNFEMVKRDQEADVQYGYLYLPDRYKSAWVIDGQHRLYGYSGLDEGLLRQNLMVVAFEKLSVQDEASLFVTINHEQKSVPRTLLDDLEGDLKWGSTVPTERIGAVAARLINRLNNDIGEPFYNRVTAQGIRGTTKTCLTVPALKQTLRRSGLIGEAILKRRHYKPGPLAAGTDLETLDRACTFLNLFFSQLREANFDLWAKGREGSICTNVGVQGYLQLVASLIEHVTQERGIEPTSLDPDRLLLELLPYMEPVFDALHHGDESWAKEVFKVPYGAGGPRQYHYRLCELVRTIAPEFSPAGFDEWSEEQSNERFQTANHQITTLNIQVQDFIFTTFREKYGEKDFWEKGVPNKDMRVGAYSRQQEDPKRLGLENYLQFIDYKKLVSTPEHWKLFKTVFDIPEKGEKGKAKNLRWMERLNELRRIAAHATKDRRYTLEELDYVQWVYDEFGARLSAWQREQDSG